MPTNMDLSQLTPQAPQQAAVAGQNQEIADQHTQATMQLAQQQQALQNAKTQQQQMQQQLDDGKVASFQKRAGLALAAPGALKGKMLDQLGGWMGQNGMDPTIADGLKDEDFATKFQQAQAAQGKNPIPSAQTLQALHSWEAFQPGVSAIYEKGQQQAVAETLANIKGGYGVNEAQIRADAMRAAIQTRAEQRDQTIHGQNLKQIAGDPQVQKGLTSLNNLSNAGSMLDGTIPLNPELLNEAQQTVRANLGVKGTSGVDERGATMMKGAGVTAAELAQFYSMKPQDIQNYGGTPFVQHIQALLNKVQGNMRDQVQNKVDTFASGHKSFYNSRPDLAEDYKNFTQNYGNLIQNQAPQSGVAPKPQGAAPQGQAGPPPATAAGGNAKLTSAVNLIRSMGVTDPARIAANLAKQGIQATPQQIQAIPGGQ